MYNVKFKHTYIFPPLSFMAYYILDPLGRNSPGRFAVIDDAYALPAKMFTDSHKESP